MTGLKKFSCSKLLLTFVFIKHFQGRELTIQMIFFDGEEAFKEWSATDSIYGARHLAQKWSGLTYDYKGVSGNHLDRIDVFVLLDLLGAKNPTIYSMNRSTEVSFRTILLLL